MKNHSCKECSHTPIFEYSEVLTSRGINPQISGRFTARYWALVCMAQWAVFAILFLCHSVDVACAQTPNSPGIEPFSTQTGSTYDTINLSTGGILITLPIQSKGGPVPYSFALQENPQLVIENAGTNFLWALPQPGILSEMRLTTSVPLEDISITYSSVTTYTCQVSNNVNDTYFQYNGVGILDGSGAVHPLSGGAGSLSYNPCTKQYSSQIGSTFITSDGSGYTGKLTSLGAQTPPYFTVFDKSGNQVAAAQFVSNGFLTTMTTPNSLTATQFYTSNSNSYTTQFVDPLAPSVLTSVANANHASQSTLTSAAGGTFSYLDSAGNQQTATLSMSTYTFQTNFGCAAKEGGPIAINLPSSLTLANNRSYTITYEPTPGFPSSVTGRIASITLPTGGQISYTYTGGTHNTGVYCDQWAGNGNAGAAVPILTRTIKDANGNQSVWTYNISDSVIPYGTSTTTVTDPANNVTTYNFVGGYQTEQQAYQGTQSATHLLKTIVTCYNGNFSNCAVLASVPVVSGFPITRTDVYTSYNTGTSSLIETTYSPAGMPTEVKQYDYGAAMPPSGAPLIDTKTTYGSWNGSSCSVFTNFIYDHPCEVTVTAPSGLLSDTRSTYDGAGNLTQLSRLTSGTSYTNQSYTYASNGALQTAKDGNGNTTQYTNGACNGLLPTQITSGPVTETETWDCNGAVVTSIKGANGDTTTYTYADPLYRLTETQYPDGGQTNLCYTDVGGTGCSQSPTVNSVVTTVLATPSPTLISSVTSDGLGRPIKSVAPGGATVTTSYTPVGYPYAVTNPHFANASPTDGFTTYVYDALGRKTMAYEPASSGSLTWRYNSNVVTYKDENLNTWTLTLDALGRLTNVVEPINAVTTYGYNATTPNMLTINQMGIAGSGDIPRATRNFYFDSASRLIQSFNPESGWTCYGTTTDGNAPNGSNCASGYDANGNLKAKTDARNKAVFYSYDGLNRLINKTYNDSTPPVSYNYDEQTVSWGNPALINTIGRLSSSSVGGTTPYSRYAYSYDLMGRPTYKSFLMPNAAGNGVASGLGSGSYTYDLAGDVTFIAQAAGVYLSITRDAGGHALTVTSDKHTTGLLNGISSYTLFTNATYSPFGNSLARLLGNGLTETRVYDPRNRMMSTNQSETGSTIGYSASATYYPNSNLQSSTDSVNGNWTYPTYNGVNNLIQATSAAGLTLTWAYDSFGNRKSQTASGTGSAPQPSFGFSGNNNRADASSGIVYDAAGNITTDNLGQSYQYDAEGRIISVSGPGSSATYEYDSEGQLVYESGSSGVEVFQRNAAGQPTWIYNPATANGPPYSTIGAYIDGEQIGSWQHDQFYWTGKDWLGTKRYESAGVGDVSSGALPVTPYSYTSLPFGDALSSIGNNPIHFTGKERDIESGNDYFGARYYSSSMGRFTSPDPSGLAFADQTNPQSLNLYSYVLNNPLTLVDSTGLAVVCDTTTTKQFSPVTFSGTDETGQPVYVLQAKYVTVQNNCVDNGDQALQPLPLGHLLQAPYNTSNASNSGLTKKQAACAADAAINGALSIFVPGYAAAKALASFGGLSFNPVGALTGTSGLFSAGNPTPLQTVGGLAGANEVYQDSRFAAAGGASALARVQDLTSRVGFGAQTASRQGRLLSQLGNLESLEGAASFASKANNITAGISAGYDIYKCVTTP